jgi:CelD/BcsL family acetyltransferase involved in cellulose biosynthesis
VKISLIAAHELDAGLGATWRALQAANPDLKSPFFSPDFIRLVGSVRRNVEIAIIEDGGATVGFFPFERSAGSLARPVGDSLSDYHGLISAGEADATFTGAELLRGCRLIAWDYARMPLSQVRLAGQRPELIACPLIELPDGYAAYAAQKRTAGSHIIERASYLARRLEREVGPLRFAAEEVDAAVLERVLGWKSAQYERTGKPDALGAAWTRALLTSIHQTRTPRFAGVLSTLQAGERLLAGHFGMRSSEVWHYWLPSYDRAFARYSPGLILILKMAEAAGQLGVGTIDLGAGVSQHKARLATRATTLASGSLELSGWRLMRRKVERHLAARVRETPLEKPARAIARSWRALSAPL